MNSKKTLHMLSHWHTHKRTFRTTTGATKARCEATDDKIILSRSDCKHYKNTEWHKHKHAWIIAYDCVSLFVMWPIRNSCIILQDLNNSDLVWLNRVSIIWLPFFWCFVQLSWIQILSNNSYTCNNNMFMLWQDIYRFDVRRANTIFEP